MLILLTVAIALLVVAFVGRRQGTARRSGLSGLHTGQRRALLREHGGIGSTVRLRFSRELVRGGWVRLR